MKKVLIALVSMLIALTISGALTVAKEMPPEPEKMKKLAFPKFKEHKLDNGLEVVVVEHHEQPIASIWLAIKSGNTLDPEGMSSLALYTAALLNKGTADKDSDQLAEWIESKGGTFNANAQNDYTVITVTILSEYIDTAYEYLAALIKGATFPEDELELERKRTKTGLEFQLSDPNSMADRHFNKVVYGHHPYAVQPTVESVEAVTRDDVVGFYDRNYVANNAMMFVVGDVNAKQVKKDTEKHFGDWRQGTPDNVEYPDPPERTAKNISLYHRPNSVQTNLYVGHLGLPPNDPDWAKVTVANRILGDGATGRLFMNLREEKGWTYGAYSEFSRDVDVGYFRATAGVRSEVTDSALTEMLHEFERIVDEPVTDDELKYAKSYLIGNFPTTIETPSQIAAQIGQVKLLGLSEDHLENYRKELSKVTKEDVQMAMQKHLHPDRMAMILVGDATVIKDKVEPIASVTLYDIEGSPMSLDELSIAGSDFEFDMSGLKEMTATYGVKVQDMMELGDMNVTLAKGDDTFEATTVIDGMIKLNESLVFGGNFTPVDYAFEMSAMGQVMSADIDFAEGNATGKIDGGPDGPKDVDVSLVEGTILSGSIDFVLSTLKLEEGQEFRFPALDAQSGGLENLKVKVVGSEDLLVPAGSFSTLKVSVSSGGAEMFYYVTKDEPHVVVKREIPSQQLSMELKDLKM